MDQKDLYWDIVKEHFIGESIRPVEGTIDPAQMAIGEPGLPAAFTWGRKTVEITTVLRKWKESGACSHGSGERYLRKHWWEVETGTHGRLKLYFQRQPKGGKIKDRWVLYSASSASD